jgi:hypothetical protein
MEERQLFLLPSHPSTDDRRGLLRSGLGLLAIQDVDRLPFHRQQLLADLAVD